MMRCVICKTGETKPGKTTVTVRRRETTVLIEDTPAEVCENCGEYYLQEAVGRRVYTQAEEAMQHQMEVTILHYGA
jgi:YgiT-type zinc finger domain-containing protein